MDGHGHTSTVCSDTSSTCLSRMRARMLDGIPVKSSQSDGTLKDHTLLASLMVLDKVVCFPQYSSLFYIDKLLLELRQQGVGCSHFAGAYAYADDLAILAPSVSALRQMFRCCECFASMHGLKFNPVKHNLSSFPLMLLVHPRPPV